MGGLAALRVPPPPAVVWGFPQAFLNGFGHGAHGARSTSGQPPRPSSTAISCRRSSGNARAPGPWQHVPSTLIATLMQQQ
jgi:hypothetical protein